MKLSKESCLALGKAYIEKHKTYPAAKKWTKSTAGCSSSQIYKHWSNWPSFIAELKTFCTVPNIIKFIPNIGLVEVLEDKTLIVLRPDKKWNKDSILAKIKESEQTHGYPKRSDFKINKEYPSLSTINSYFGSWQEALSALSIKRPTVVTEKIKEFLTKELVKYSDYLPAFKTLDDAVNLFMLGNNKAGWNANTAKKFTDKFPNKVSGKQYYLWFLQDLGLKWCKGCDCVLAFDNFNSNVTTFDQVQSWCKTCTTLNMKKYSDRGAKRRVAVLRSKPSWVDERAIATFYKNCPQEYHVDHIVPLQGKNVCGLHVPWNLQYLSAKDNISKSNKFNGGWASWDGSTFTS